MTGSYHEAIRPSWSYRVRPNLNVVHCDCYFFFIYFFFFFFFAQQAFTFAGFRYLMYMKPGHFGPKHTANQIIITRNIFSRICPYRYK